MYVRTYLSLIVLSKMVQKFCIDKKFYNKVIFLTKAYLINCQSQHFFVYFFLNSKVFISPFVIVVVLKGN